MRRRRRRTRSRWSRRRRRNRRRRRRRRRRRSGHKYIHVVKNDEVCRTDYRNCAAVYSYGHSSHIQTAVSILTQQHSTNPD
jgi:hypothetical protein